MSEEEIQWHHNSTNVRIFDLQKVFRHLFLSFGWRTAPGRTARLLRRTVFSPSPHPLTPEAETWMDKGRPFRIRVGDRMVQGWEWGRGPAVLFAHGWNGRAAHFFPFFSPLIEAGHSVMAFDAPGHGVSQGNDTSYFEMTDVVRALLKTASGGGVRAVVGHSLGASAVINALSRENATPATVLVAPALDMEGLLYPAFERHGIPRAVYRGVIAEYERKFGYSMQRDNPIRLLPSLGHPIFIVHDRSDPTTSYLDSLRMAEEIDDIRLHSTTGLGHKRILTDPDVIDHIIRYVTEEVRPAPEVPVREHWVPGSVSVLDRREGKGALLDKGW